MSPLFATLRCDEKKFGMTAYHGIKACFFCTLYIVFWRADGPKANLECYAKQMWQKGPCWATNIPCQGSCTKPISKNYCPRSNGLEAWCRRFRYEKLLEHFETKIARNHKANQNTQPKTQLNGFISQSFAKQGSTCHHSFATIPRDEKKLRMTTSQGTKACCICTVYIFL